jgi:hypothetical protein
MDGIAVADPLDYLAEASSPAPFTAFLGADVGFVGVKCRRWPVRFTPHRISRAPTLCFARNGNSFLRSAPFSG